MISEETLANNAAFRRMEQSIKETYPYGQFVAIADGMIIGDAADFMTLYHALESTGRDPKKVMIIQAGHYYPEYVYIPWV